MSRMTSAYHLKAHERHTHREKIGRPCPGAGLCNCVRKSGRVDTAVLYALEAILQFFCCAVDESYCLSAQVVSAYVGELLLRTHIFYGRKASAAHERLVTN